MNVCVELRVWTLDGGQLNVCEGLYMEHCRRRLTNPSGVVSVDASPPGISLQSTIIHDGPSWTALASQQSVGIESHELIQAVEAVSQHRAQ